MAAKKKTKRKIYRDGLGRFTTKEKYQLLKDVVKKGLRNSKTGKVEKLTFKEATKQLEKKILKVVKMGYALLTSIEEDVNYYYENNKSLRGKITNVYVNYPEFTHGYKTMTFLSYCVKIAFRALRSMYGQKLDSPPPVIPYLKETLPNSQKVLRVIIDFNDIQYQDEKPFRQ